LADAEHAVEHLVTVPLEAGSVRRTSGLGFQLGRGAGRLQMSTLLKVLNAGSYGSVLAQLMEVIRREAEVKLFTGA
jgi:GH24 family phage-related lysozyme (muramidase)